MSLTHVAFAIAGLIAAAGPVLIHLLNRRRFRTVEWGAMVFLRNAMRHSRRAVRLRDLLLLALRTAAVLLFGFALARPVLTSGGLGTARIGLLSVAILAAFGGAIAIALARNRWHQTIGGVFSLAGIVAVCGLVLASRDSLTAAQATASSREPVHAILIIDNSRSMATRTIDGTLLDVARRRAAEVIGSLPRGSRISVMPLCGPERSYTLDGHLHEDDARSALDRIAITDRSGSVLRMIAMAAEAAERVPELPAKRPLFFSDQQASGWPRRGVAEAVKSWGGDVHFQMVQVTPDRKEPGDGPRNVWIDSFVVQDGLAEANQPATFLATVRCQGQQPVDDVELTLRLAGSDVASRTIDLKPGQTREVSLTAQFDTEIAAGSTTVVPVDLVVRVADPAANELERDDVRHLAVPVVSAVPVVFVDQFGDDENLDAGRIGETYRLRRLLAPRPAEGVYDPFVTVRRLTFPELTSQRLEDARLVVVAGVERPTDDGVRLLRQYVEQGGPLVIAAGANFDPAAWTASAWLDGLGVLPAPLAETPVGVRPSQATAASQITPFRLDTSSLGNPLFQIRGEAAGALADLWRQPFFFQAVDADVSEDTVARAVSAEAERITAERAVLDRNSDTEPASGWLRWKTSEREADGDNPNGGGRLTPQELASRTSPRVLARFEKRGASGDGMPYLIERRIGYGRILLLTAGLSSDWDTLAQTNAIILLDRITRSLLEGTLPSRNFTTGDGITVPIERRADVVYSLTSPGEAPVSLPAEATPTGYALQINETSIAGEYSVSTQPASGGVPIDIIALAVNGPNEESDLTPIDTDRILSTGEDDSLSWVGPADELFVTGGPVRGNDLWRWLIGAVLICLMVELAVAARWKPAAGEANP